jgi:hypothetical protein
VLGLVTKETKSWSLRLKKLGFGLIKKKAQEKTLAPYKDYVSV